MPLTGRRISYRVAVHQQARHLARVFDRGGPVPPADQLEMNRYLVVAAYDIGSDSRRMDLSSLLSGLGARVQFSVFELELTDVELAALVERVRGVIDPADDQVRLWVLPGATRDHVVVLGNRRLEERADFFIV